MVMIINGSDGIEFPDGSDQTTAVSSVSPSFSGNLSFNSGYGSAAVAYGCRAWVNFNGTGTPAIRASGNVTSVTDNGTGDYTLNFTTALPDANYNVVTGINSASAANPARAVTIDSDGTTATLMTTTQLRLQAGSTGGTATDEPIICISIFR